MIPKTEDSQDADANLFFEKIQSIWNMLFCDQPSERWPNASPRKSM